MTSATSTTVAADPSGRLALPATALGVLAGMGAAALLVALSVLVSVGATDPPSGPRQFDPGPVARYGLPVTRTLHDLAAAVTVGALGLATWLVGPDPDAPPRALTGVRQLALRIASPAVGVWMLAAAATLVLTVADVSGLSPGTPGFAGFVVSFATQVDLGRALGASLVLVVITANLVVLAGTVVASGWATVCGVLALLPLALAGHAAGSRDHMNSVDSLALHLIGVVVWVGGLAALLLVAAALGPRLGVAAQRYSRLAGWGFALVAVSGLVNAALRLGSFDNLATTYGLLVLGKAVALVLLGAAGWWHRRSLLPGLEDAVTRRRSFLRLVAGELIVLGATMGLAVAMSRTPPPVPGLTPEDPVASLLGYPEPPPLTVARYLTAFYPSVLWLAVACAALGWYLWSVRRLHQRGDAWPWSRTIFWTLGCLALIFVTSGGPAVYGRLSFSAHMLQHMSLMVVVPLLLVFGAPATLALRTVPARRDGSFGVRETILALVHARPLRLLGHPIAAALLFTGSLVVFYYTGLFRLAMFTHGGHVLMTAHFLGVGYLFVWSLVGLDPGPARPPYPLRMLLLLITLAFHAFFGISLMEGGTVLAPDWWQALGRTDPAALLSDQRDGGAIAWAAGDLPAFALMLALIVAWVRSDRSETRRRDRQADRDDDAELRAYNDRLAELSRRDQRR